MYYNSQHDTYRLHRHCQWTNWLTCDHSVKTVASIEQASDSVKAWHARNLSIQIQRKLTLGALYHARTLRSNVVGPKGTVIQPFHLKFGIGPT